MRIVVTTVATALGAALLIPAVTAPSAVGQVVPSASAPPSGSPLPDARVELSVSSELDPVRNWAIAVTDGTASVDNVTVPDNASILFAVTVFGATATVEMTATLPAGGRLTLGTCFDQREQVGHDALADSRRLVLEVVPGGFYDCVYASNVAGPPEPTVPATDALADVRTGFSPGGWPIALAMLAAVMAASVLIGIRARLRL
jgi:hypothetical protein